MVTAYDQAQARCLEAAGVDVVLVGDSVGEVALGYATTLPVTMEMMLHHTRAVSRAISRALLVADMPFLSYQTSPAEAVRNAGRFLQEAGAQAVKFEGGQTFAPAIQAITAAGIPLMGHLGYTPQSVYHFVSQRVRGGTLQEARRLYRDAIFLEQAGCFAIVLECVPATLARAISERLQAPTIGIGSGPHCDGQVLVFHDLVGWSFGPPLKHSKSYADLSGIITQAVSSFAQEVRSGAFPTGAHSFVAREYAELSREVLEGEDK